MPFSAQHTFIQGKYRLFIPKPAPEKITVWYKSYQVHLKNTFSADKIFEVPVPVKIASL